MEGEPTLAILNNEMVESRYKNNHIQPIVLEGDAKVEHDNKWKTYCERIAQLYKQRGQTLSMIRGQCMQFLIDNMKQNPDWVITSESYYLPTLIKLIKKIWLRPKTNIDM